MLDRIRSMFRNVTLEKEAERAVDHDVTDAEARQRAAEKKQSLPYYYLELYVSQLSRTATYRIQEQLKSGTIVTHDHGCDYEQMAWYVKAIFLPSHPPKLIITAM